MAKTSKTAKSKASGEKGTCIMTGRPTSSPKALFSPGMDARLKGMLLRVYRGDANLNSIPAEARKALRSRGETGLVGFRLKGDQLEHFGNFATERKAPASKKSTKAKEKSTKVKAKDKKVRRRPRVVEELQAADDE